MSQPLHAKNGFTLIELIVVIIILGILAATAAPKFIDFASDARVSTVQALEGSIRSANSMVYGKAALQGKEKDKVAVVDLGNGSDTDVAYGYLAADINSFVDAMQLSLCNVNSRSGECDSADWLFKVKGQDLVFYPVGKNDVDKCSLTYAEATDQNNREPAYVLSLDEC